MLFLFLFSSLLRAHVLSFIARFSLLSSHVRLSFFPGTTQHHTKIRLVVLHIIFFSLANKQDPGIAGGLGEGKTKRPHWHIGYRQDIVMKRGPLGVDTYLYIT